MAIPFIVLTANPSPETRQAAIKAGALAYCVKPPDPDNLVNTVEVALALAAERSNQAREAVVHRAVGILMVLHQLDEAGAREALVTWPPRNGGNSMRSRSRWLQRRRC